MKTMIVIGALLASFIVPVTVKVTHNPCWIYGECPNPDPNPCTVDRECPSYEVE